MFKDKIVLGVVAGLTATLVKDSLNHLLYGLHILRYLFAQYASGMFIQPAEAKTVVGVIVGYLTDFVISSLIGVTFVYLLGITKSKHIVLQGIGFGLTSYLAIYGGLLQMGVSSIRARTPSDAIFVFFIHLLYGFVLGYFVSKFGQSILVNWKKC